MNNIKVSVIVPVYNVALFVRKCLDSLISQTLEDIEIICVDDGSTDNSFLILKEYENKHKKIRIIQKPNGGLSSARNSGMKKAKGEYIIFVDSDDWVDENYCEALYYTAHSQNADLARASYILHYPKKIKREKHLYPILLKKHKANLTLGMNDHSVVVWNAIYRREYLIENNIYYFDECITVFEDITFTLRATYFSKKSIPVISTFLHYRRTEKDCLSAINIKALDTVPLIHEMAIDFLNSNIFENKDDYLTAFRRCMQRYDTLFKKGMEVSEFNKDKQADFLNHFVKDFHKCKYIEDFMKKYPKRNFKYIYQKDIPSYLNAKISRIKLKSLQSKILKNITFGNLKSKYKLQHEKYKTILSL